MEKNTNSEIENKIDNDEVQNGTEYRFVRETIIDKKTRFKRGLLKVIANFILILVVCVVTCFIFINFINSREKHKDEQISSDTGNENKNTTIEGNSGNEDTGSKSTDDKTGEATTKKDEVETTSEFTEEEKIEKAIANSIIVFKGYNDGNVNTFAGVVLSKSGAIVAVTSIHNVLEAETISGEVGGLVDIPTNIIAKDDELQIAFIKINKDDIEDREIIEKITVPTISNVTATEIGTNIKFCGWIENSGMTLLNGKVLSQGITENITDISYNKYMIDVSVSNITDGFVFDGSGNFIAMSVLNENEAGKMNVIDLNGFKTELYSVINRGYATRLGIIGQKVTMEIENLVGEELPDGMYVTEVKMDSPAYKAGIMVGDIIYKINTTSVENLTDIRKYLDSKQKGDVVTVYLYRNMGTRYNTYTIPVELDERK